MTSVTTTQAPGGWAGTKDMTVENLVKTVQKNFPSYDVEAVRKAYDIADAAHHGQQRKTGEPFVMHCLSVAEILADLRIDPPVVVAGLLHDTVEDTSMTLDNLRADFGDEVAQLVDGVTKLGQIGELANQPGESSNKQAENLRKMFLAMAEDVRVVLIKLADRLHNMRTLHGMPREKQVSIARETLDIYAPLANRLGIWQIKWELEDLCFRYLEPDTYRQVADNLAQRRADREEYVDNVINMLHENLREDGIEAEISGRPKHIYSIYKKMQRKERDFEQIYDVHGVRIIVDTIRDCYAALGIVHSLWRPVPGEFDDYIANPKENNYQSLHTAIVGPEGKPFEVQIRTHEMHYIAEYGIAAHWRYKEKLTKRDKVLEEKVRWLRSLLEWRQEVTDAEEFVDSVKSDMLPERVLVFTPKGEIKELPAGATPIDFAYMIHTEVGHRCRGAKVNGKIVSLNYQLQDGDQVEIITAKRDGPSRDWLNPHLSYVKTQRARSKIRRWFRKQDREVNIQQGREMLEREIKRLDLGPESFERLASLSKYDDLDDFLAAIGYGDISPQTIAARALEVQRREEEEDEFDFDEELTTKDITPPTPETTDVMIQGVGDIMTKMAGCCNPLPGDEIVGYITKGHGITIHRRTCSNILNKSDSERLIEVSWGNGEEQVYPVMIKVHAFDRGGLLRDIADIVAKENVNMRAANAMTSKQDHSAVITATLEIESAAQLSRILHLISRLPNVLDAYRQRT